MINRIFICFVFIFSGANLNAQKWSKEDSLKLKRLLESHEEIKLNNEAVKRINLGQMKNAPLMSEDKKWIAPDPTLPSALPTPKPYISLMPYKSNTPFNWDPFYRKKIIVRENTWRNDPFYDLRRQISYSNWAHSIGESGERKTLDQIRASGVRSQFLGERANNMMVTKTSVAQGTPLFIGKSGARISGNSIQGLDLMAVFTRKYWSWEANKTRSRTLEVLQQYGDSTSVNINHPILYHEQNIP